jgi:hypothetical protein
MYNFCKNIYNLYKIAVNRSVPAVNQKGDVIVCGSDIYDEPQPIGWAIKPHQGPSKKPILGKPGTYQRPTLKPAGPMGLW